MQEREANGCERYHLHCLSVWSVKKKKKLTDCSFGVAKGAGRSSGAVESDFNVHLPEDKTKS